MHSISGDAYKDARPQPLAPTALLRRYLGSMLPAIEMSPLNLLALADGRAGRR